jgi:hypothetical protein
MTFITEQNKNTGGLKKYHYAWPQDIWSIHLEIRNPGDESGIVEIHYDNTDHIEAFPYFASENMRYNICRYSTDNMGITVYLPPNIELFIFENLDRAFYTADPIELS